MGSKKMIIMIALVIIVGAGSFYGGMQYDKSVSASQKASRGGNGQFAQGQRTPGSANGANRNGGVGQNGNGFVSGEVLSKDDKSITVKMRDGSSKIVYFSDSTTVGKTVGGSATDLNTGQQVVVNGQGNTDGSLTAQNIQIRPDQPTQ